MKSSKSSPSRAPATTAIVAVACISAAVIALGALLTFDRTDAPAASSGFVSTSEVAPPPTGTLRSPAGRRIEAGSTDELGWVLPLDVRRPTRDTRTSPFPRPGAGSGPPASRSTPTAFEEYRLGPDNDHTQNETSIDAVADMAVEVNTNVENIGARRLMTVMERILDDISFSAADKAGDRIVVDAAYVEEHIGDLAKNADLSKFIL